MEQSEATDDLAAVAAEAVRAGGEYLAGEFRTGRVDGEYGTDDVKAVADREAERRVRSVVESAFPEHGFRGEEEDAEVPDHLDGVEGASDYVWVVDPLDGTNNFASGLPAFATAVCVFRAGSPVVAAVYEPLPDTLYLARRGEGATVDGRPLTVRRPDRPLSQRTVSLVCGLEAVRDSRLRETVGAVETALERRCKRVVQTWAPCVDWGLVARGSLAGIVCLHPDVYEQCAGELLAAEAGVASVAGDGLYVGAADRSTLAELRTALPASVLADVTLDGSGLCVGGAGSVD